MEQRFAIAVHICGELRNILQVALGGDRLLQVVGGAALHTVLVGGVRDDTFFFCGGHGSRVNAKRHAVLFAEIAEQCLFRGACRVFPQCPDTAECISANKIVRKKFNHGRCDHIQESFLRLGREISVNGAYFLLQDNPPIV